MSYQPNPFARKHDVRELQEYLSDRLEENQDDPKHRNRLDVPGAGPLGSLGHAMGPPESEASAKHRAELVNRLKYHLGAYLKSRNPNVNITKWRGNRPESATDFAEAYDAFRELVWYYRGLGGRRRDYY